MWVDRAKGLISIFSAVFYSFSGDLDNLIDRIIQEGYVLRHVLPLRPRTTLALYLLTSTAVVILPTIYFLQECEIDKQYYTYTHGYCASGVSGILGLFITSMSFMLLVPVSVGIVFLQD